MPGCCVISSFTLPGARRCPAIMEHVAPMEWPAMMMLLVSMRP